jgi:hypothetical protein
MRTEDGILRGIRDFGITLDKANWVESEQLTVNSEQWKVDSEQWTVNSEQLTVNS